MRSTRLALVGSSLLAAGLLVGTAPLTAEPDAASSEGILLLESLPRMTDLVVQTPSLPALRTAIVTSGVGDDASWSKAFGEQLRRWGAFSGEPEKLEAAGRAMLRAADGEALVASMPLKIAGDETRATLLAFRTTWTDAKLHQQLKVVVSHGLRDEYLDATTEQEIVGRRVLALRGHEGGLWVHAADGLVAASDHPLGLALFFRGLRRAAEEDLPTVAGLSRLAVRFGRDDAAWHGFVLGAREGVSWQAGADEQARKAPIGPAADPLVAIALREVAAAPLLPAPLPEWLVASASSVRAVAGEEPVSIAQRADGSYQLAARFNGEQAVIDEVLAHGLPEGVVARRHGEFVWVGPSDAEPGEFPVQAGATTRNAWLRGLAAGRFALPAGVDRELLLGPLAATDGARPPIEWTPSDRAGELRGPAYDGPATFLALRTLAHIATGTAPDLPAPPVARPSRPDGPPIEPGTGAPLPPPTESSEPR